MNKSLIITFWGKRSSKFWLINNIHLKYPEDFFDYIIMIYDNSTWNFHPIYDKAIWIRVKDQMRFWFLKRFLSPYLIQSYNYIWIIDQDIQFDFNPLVYECILNHYQILLSSPGRLLGSISYLFTRISPQYENKIGRWTDFVETGPLIVFNSSAFACIWNFINEKNILTQKICAILDSFSVNHLAEGINTVDYGNQELSAYEEFYRNYKTKRQNFGPIDKDLLVLDSCTNIYSNNQSSDFIKNQN
ncbi:hypothetical protein I4U23_027106 [Adineta vaga]|nr:hypothetical protein I4U23_027106 [Adineta vaga]